jgi:hypothetical protein
VPKQHREVADEKVTSTSSRRDFAYYAAKDQAMAHDAKCGIMLWDGKSKETLVYLSTEKAFHKIINEQELDALLARCDSHAVDRAQREIKTKLSAQLLS